MLDFRWSPYTSPSTRAWAQNDDHRIQSVCFRISRIINGIISETAIDTNGTTANRLPVDYLIFCRVICDPTRLTGKTESWSLREEIKRVFTIIYRSTVVRECVERRKQLSSKFFGTLKTRTGRRMKMNTCSFLFAYPEICNRRRTDPTSKFYFLSSVFSYSSKTTAQ